ncbi:hypothetical protein ACFLUU_03550 [Chloroflexota bacterium]
MATVKARIRPLTTAKILLTALALTLLLSLLGTISSTDTAAATPDEVKWSRVNTPTEGEAGNWVLASGSNIQHMTMAVDGTIYGYANPSATSYTLFKSTDAGYSWSHTGQVKDALVDIATTPDDASIVYYATVANIYRSADAGNSFILLPPSPGGAGSGNITISSIDVARLEGSIIIAVGTRDTNDSQYGGVYILDENKPFTGWINTNIGNYDICAVAFSPNFAADRQLVAVVTDEADTLVTTRISDNNWGTIIGDAKIEGLTPRAVAIAFPDNYDATSGDYALFVAVDTGSDNGDVYMVKGMWAPGNSAASDLDIGSAYNLSNVDVTGLAVSGNSTAASLLAGAANSAQVYISTDSGSNWTRSDKVPTGQTITYLLMAPDFTSSGLAYAATTGTESALSHTTDGGITWNQIGLIDTKISQNGIIALAVSPKYGQDDTLFMLTFDGEHTEHSLWRSLNSGAKWERVFISALASADSINLIQLSPQYGSGSQVVFLAGTSYSNPAIWKSTDNGQSFTRQSAPFSIDTWTVVNDNTLFLGSHDGSNGLVYGTTNSGLFYSTEVVAGSHSLKSTALSPDYEQDTTILLGNTNGWVYWSSDNGTSFEPLPPWATSPPLSGEITVAFDPEFSSNRVVYAASDTEATTDSKERIHRFIIGKSDTWESIDNTLPAGSMLSQLTVSVNGTLYAINSQPLDAVNKEGGMERSFNPTYPLTPTFETVTRSFDDGATLTGLWLQDNQLWSIDSKNTKLMTYTDSLALPVSLTSPANRAPSIGTRNVSLEWATLKGATEYKWQLNYETNFSTVPAEFEGDTQASSAWLPVLEPATTYYWRVRATKPVLSRWSAKWSFTTSLGTVDTTTELYSPKAGASGVPLKPVFQWDAMAGADSYELLVSIDASFSNPIIVKIGDYALPATAWQSDISLDYGTTYFWKVRASGSSSYSTWSAVAAFTTESPPSQSPPAQELSSSSPAAQLSSPPPPAAQLSSSSPAPELSLASPSSPPAQSTLPDWLIYLAFALLLTIVLLLITLLVMIAGIRRP